MSNKSKSAEFADPFAQQVAELTPEVYANLKRALELGKWPNGDLLSASQREICMDAIILYDHHHLPESERVSYIEKSGCKSDAASSTQSVAQDPEESTPLRWK